MWNLLTYLVIHLLLYVKYIYSQHDERWRYKEYLIRLETTRYFGINLYRSKNAATTNETTQLYIRNVILLTIQTFAWHNIKFVIKSDIKQPYINLTNNNMTETHKLFRQYLLNNTDIKNDEYHMLLLYDDIQDKSDVQGNAVRNTNCYPKLLTAVTNLYIKHNLYYTMPSVALSHEMGHMLGLEHTNSTLCIPYLGSCIMNPRLAYWNKEIIYPPGFNVVSINNITRILDNCPDNDLTKKYVNIRPYQLCGNGFVDPDEECDCGFRENCILNGEYDCCDPKTCKFKNNTQCSFGDCCRNCKFKKGNVCRAKNDECDLPEYCDGSSAFCPFNKKLPDGTKCLDNNYCFNGKCPNVTQQCQELFKTENIRFEDKCYDVFPRIIERGCDSKNRGNGEILKKCKYRGFARCSLLQCVTKSEITRSHYWFSRRKYGINCAYTIPEWGGFNLAFVPNGFQCGQNMACVNNGCRNMSETYLSCKDINCGLSMICYRGRCIKEYSTYTNCKDVVCRNGQYCNKYGECDKFMIPEIYVNYHSDVTQNIVSIGSFKYYKIIIFSVCGIISLLVMLGTIYLVLIKGSIYVPKVDKI